MTEFIGKYDDASWHYEGDYPENLPVENASTHIGFFLKWCILNSLVSESLTDDAEEEIQSVVQGEMTGAQFLIDMCDEKLCEEDLSETGNLFAMDYYQEDTKFGKKFNSYLADFSEMTSGYPSSYHMEDSLENYELIAGKIDERYEQWKKFKGV
jgi:hypothetical protein